MVILSRHPDLKLVLKPLKGSKKRASLTVSCWRSQADLLELSGCFDCVCHVACSPCLLMHSWQVGHSASQGLHLLDDLLHLWTLSLQLPHATWTWSIGRNPHPLQELTLDHLDGYQHSEINKVYLLCFSATHIPWRDSLRELCLQARYLRPCRGLLYYCQLMPDLQVILT
jgi:hypothetical protein